MLALLVKECLNQSAPFKTNEKYADLWAEQLFNELLSNSRKIEQFTFCYFSRQTTLTFSPSFLFYFSFSFLLLFNFFFN